jgi:undecaprenyl-diphosphatase
MPIWIAVLLGAVQGFAEFLPISSSGHLALVQHWLDFHRYGADALAFDVILHLGTLVAVCIAFWGDIVRLVKAALGLALDKGQIKGIASRRMLLMLLIACVPLVVGAFLEGAVEAAMGSVLFIGCALIITAVMLWLADRLGGGGKSERDAPYRDGLIVGLWQLFAIFPGISRSGATMCGGLFSGFRRDFAVRFAFILSIPAVLGSAVLQLPDLFREGVPPGHALPYFIGFVTAAVCGYLAIRLVKALMRKGGFRWFAVYCAAMGAFAIATHIWG